MYYIILLTVLQLSIDLSFEQLYTDTAYTSSLASSIYLSFYQLYTNTA